MKAIPVTFLLIVIVVSSSAQDLVLQPGWRLIQGAGQYQNDPQTGARCLTISGDGDAADYWTLDYEFASGELYEMVVDVCISSGTSSQAIVIGTDFANKDLKAQPTWTEQRVIFQVPRHGGRHYFRLGIWETDGTAWFKNLRLYPVKAVHRRANGVTLGDGETIRDRHYHCTMYYAHVGSNFTRTLHEFKGRFNTHRWDLYVQDYVMFRHHLAETMQHSAEVTLNVNYRFKGELHVAASHDGELWAEVGKCPDVGRYTFTLPTHLFPSEVIYIRISASGLLARLQFNEYRYAAQVPGAEFSLYGNTDYFSILQSDPTLHVNFVASDPRNIRTVLQAQHMITPYEVIYTSGDTTVKREIRVSPHEPNVLELPIAPTSLFQNMTIVQKGHPEPVFQARGSNSVPYLEWEHYGHFVNRVDDLTLWWTDATQKIGRSRRPPSPATRKPLQLWQAKHEYEALQLVLAPETDITVSLQMSELRHPSGYRLPDSSASLFLVDVVNVEVPTDQIGAPGPWPDPLPPLDGPASLKAGENQPFWILVYIPPDAPAGSYSGSIHVSANGRLTEIPLRINVWDFTLPQETHLQTAFGFYPSFVQQYHHFSETDRLDDILDLYFKHFSEHRISPYDPFVLNPIEVEFDRETLTAHLDFSKFDRAYEYYIKTLGFNSFRLNIQGLAAGSFHFRREGKIAGYSQGTPEYKALLSSYLRQLEDHLAELGALDQAYIYWFDEPQPKDYDFIWETMQLIEEAAPRLQRMLTEQPEPELVGAVDIWCPVLHRYQPQRAHGRQRDGDRMWWYICTSPKAPYPGLFIDHYAVELRTWIWQSWKYDIEGILVWSSNFWTSRNVFPPPQRQNPYEDPMSYRTGGAVQPGEISYWGNGDGRFIYPPKAVFESQEPCLEGPVSSIRWEILRDGLEDYEYFWLLRSLADSLDKHGTHRTLVTRAREVLRVPEDVTSGLTEFSKTPEPLYRHRHKLAEMILQLQNAL